VIAARRLPPAAWTWGLVPLVLIGPFLLWPLGSMLWRAFSPEGALSLDAVGGVLGDRFYWERLGFTTAQAAASTLLTLLAGIPAAYVFANIRFPGRSAVRALATVPFVLPTIVVALAFQRIVGPEGWLNDALGLVGLGPIAARGTLGLILAAHVFYNVAIVLRLVAGVWANLDPRLEDAARALGASGFTAFRLVTFPALLPAIASASALVFTFTFTSFGVVLILGGPGLDTLEVTIYRLTTRLVQLPEAAVLSFVQLAATFTAFALYAWLQRRTTVPLRPHADRGRALSETTRGERALLAAVLGSLALLIGTPIVALAHGALTVGQDGPTLANFGRLFEDTGRISYVAPGSAIRWSLTFAVGATLIALVVGLSAAMAIARTRRGPGALLDAVLMLPLAVPAVVLGLGYVTTFNRGVLDLRGSPWLVLMAHALLAYPFVLRAVLAVLRSRDPRLPEAATMLGASPARVWRHVELPIAARALLVGAVFAFAVSLGEFGATLLLRRQDIATMPVAIFEALGRPGQGNLGQALAMATILLVVTAAGFLVIERFRYREVGEF
jgi:thiamine transport system permease protein